MTISSTNTKNSYSGDDSTVAFSYTFKILDDDDIQVILRTNATGTETVQTKTTHYSVSGVGNASGGTITFVSAPAATETVVLLRNVPLTQTTDYTPNDPFPAVTHEDALDKLTLMAQDTQEEVDRSIKLSRTNTMTSTEFTVGATARANKIFAFDSSGELAVTQEIGTFQGDWAASTAYAERDLVKDTSTNNIFIVNSAHTSSGSQPLTTNPNASKYDLIVDAASATTSATNAATSATAAATSATAAANSATAAATSESNAAASEAGVAADAAAAAASAASASTSETNASTSETNAANSASAAATSATNAATSATSASNSASSAGTSETNAATSATNASNSASAAATSASNASTSETNAATSESNASTSASSASTSASNAAASAAAAAASFDAFDDIYLGAKASAPTVDNDGDALTEGDQYFNTTNNTLFVWNGSAWQAASPDIVADTTPQLGGDLDLNGNDITGTGNIDNTGTLTTDGLTVAGNVSVDGGTIKLDGNYPTGSNNVALGNAALDDASLSGDNNTAVGATALSANTTGASNVAVGASALDANTTANENTAVGYNSLTANTTGARNTSVGASALATNTTGTQNAAVGFYALQANTEGSKNVAIGQNALDANTTADDNTAVGFNSLGANTTGTQNTAVGAEAGDAITDSDGNSAFGYGSLSANTTGDYNTALGRLALRDATTADGNVAVGSNSLLVNTTGTQNVAVGFQALDANTTANSNVAIGYAALGANTTASNNTAVGTSALLANTTGANTTALGQAAGVSATGSYNVFVGARSGNSQTSGDQNTYVGEAAGYSMTTGTRNTILGRFSGNGGGLDIRTSSNYIVLSDGDGNPRQIIDSNGNVRINNTSNATYSAFLNILKTAGTNATIHSRVPGSFASSHIIFGNDTADAVGSIDTNGSATSYNTSSDYRLKENVADMTGAIDRVKALAPKRFNWVADDDDTMVDGFLAHEAQAVVPEAVTGTHNEVDDDGNPVMQGIDQSKLVPLLTGALQEAIAKIEDLETRLAALEGAN